MPFQGSTDSEVSHVPAARDEALGRGLDASVRANARGRVCCQICCQTEKNVGLARPTQGHENLRFELTGTHLGHSGARLARRSTVFKTVARPAFLVEGGFDSHAPPPEHCELRSEHLVDFRDAVASVSAACVVNAPVRRRLIGCPRLFRSED